MKNVAGSLAALVLSLLLVAPASAQSAGSIELTRAEIQKSRQAIIAHAMDLTEEESLAFWPAYRDYRLDVARGNNGGAQFTTDSFDEIYHYSGGIPRLINILCDRALLIAYVANTRVLDGRLIREGIRDLESPQSSGERPVRP